MEQRFGSSLQLSPHGRLWHVGRRSPLARVKQLECRRVQQRPALGWERTRSSWRRQWGVHTATRALGMTRSRMRTRVLLLCRVLEDGSERAPQPMHVQVTHLACREPRRASSAIASVRDVARTAQRGREQFKMRAVVAYLASDDAVEGAASAHRTAIDGRRRGPRARYCSPCSRPSSAGRVDGANASYLQREGGRMRARATGGRLQGEGEGGEGEAQARLP